MIKKILLIVVLAVFVGEVRGQGGRVEYNSDVFVTGGRRVQVKGEDAMIVREVSEKLARHGAIVSGSVFAKVFSPTVELQGVALIDGYTSAYAISVKPNHINITFTNAEMMRLAVDEFYKLFDAPYGQRLVRGCNLLYFTAVSSVRKESLRSNDSGVYDGVSVRLPESRIVEEMSHKLRRKRGADFILAVGNRREIRVDFSALVSVNPELAVVEQHEKYQDEEIRRFVETAEKYGGNFVPAIDLLNENESFVRYTGHRMQSLEGQRFVRAMLEELRYRWGIKKVCVGTLSKSSASKQYLEFLFYVANKNGMVLITL